ncbi:MAG: inositol monophosphatase family protein [Pseudomonadota bacterium]
MTRNLTDQEILILCADTAKTVTSAAFRTALDIDNKASADLAIDPVTAADRDAEQAIRDVLSQNRPMDGILGEEYGETREPSMRHWVIDPIDGTRAFVCGIPTWTTLIALNDGSKPVLGAIDQPYLGERYVGDGSSAHLNNKPIKTSDCAHLADARITTTDPGLFTESETQRFNTIRQASALCRYGLDGYGYALLAAGHIDAVIESGLKPYDIQAHIPIITGAGLNIIWQGGDAQMGGQVVAAATRELHATLLPLLNEV